MRDNTLIRPIQAGDVDQLEEWRQLYTKGELELPHGYAKQGVQTWVITEGGDLVMSLTGSYLIGLDPLIKNPSTSPATLSLGLQKLEAVLTAKAVEAQCVDAFIAVPDTEVEYLSFLKKRGYIVTAQNCVILRKKLT